jgi:hypothetical protein
MNKPAFSAVTHLSIVWAVTLAVITIIEWRNLEQDPLNREILSPFIQREITVYKAQPERYDTVTETAELNSGDGLRYEVEFHFTGPLFLLCFFGPVLVFLGVGRLWNMRKSNRS